MSSHDNANLATVEPSQEDGQLLVSTRFMEQFEAVRAVSGGTELFPFTNFGGNIDVYSVGTNNRVYRIRQQSDSRTGWTDADLGFDASQLSLHAFAAATLDAPAIFGLNAASQLTLSKWDGNAYRQKVSQPPGATAKLKQFRAAQSVLGNIHANVIIENDEVATSFVKPDGVWQSNDWVPIKAKQGGTENAKVRRIAMCTNNPLQTSLYAIGMANEVLFADANFRFSYFVQLATLTAIDITVVEDTEKRLNIFAIDTAHRLWQKRQKKFSSGGGIEWESWLQVDEKSQIPLQSSRAVVSFDGGLEIFAIGEDGLLYHTRQLLDSAGIPTGWGTIFPLGNPVPSSIFAVGRSGGGYSEAFSVTRDNFLYRFWQDPVTTQWYSGEIALQERGEMASVPAHSVELTVVDSAGYPRAEADVTIHTSTLVPLRINGLYYIVSEYDGVTVKSGTDGKVMIERFTNALTAPTLYVVTPFMDEGEGVTVEPNASLQDQMRLTTQEKVWEARGADGEYLLKGDNRTEENAKALAGIMQRSMSLGYPPPESNQSLRYIARNRSLTGLRHVKRGESPFRNGLRLVPEQHWHVTLGDGQIRVRDLTRGDVPMLLASAPMGDAAFFGIDWGDLWQSVKEGVGQIIGAVKEFIVTTIIDPITGLVDQVKVFFHLVIDTVSQWIDTTIQAFQQAFDIVEGIWNKLKVFFEDLFKWLAFLFQWDDIRRTADVVEHSFNATLDFFTLAMQQLRKSVDDGFGQFEENLQRWFDTYMATLSDQETTGQFISPAGRESPTVDAGTSHNPLLNGYMQNLSDGVQVSAPAMAENSSVIEAVVAELEKLADNFQFGTGKAVFDEAISYFQQAGSNPDNFFTLVYKGLVKLVEAIALWGVAVARGVVLSLIDIVIDLVGFIKTMANEEWEVPFVSALYKFITGETLSFRPIRIFAYIVAIPTTIVYKIVDGNAPFPDQASVDAFRAEYTADFLARQAGIITTQTKRSRKRDAVALTGPRPVWGKILGTAFGILTLVMIPIDTAQAMATAVYPIIKPSRLLGWAFVTGRALWSIFSIPWAISEDAGGLGCHLGTKELNNTRWLCNAIGGPLRGYCILVVRDLVKKKVAPWIGESTLALWGVANLGWVLAITIKGGVWDAEQASENIMLTLGPQALRICPIDKVYEATRGVSLAILVAGLLSYLPIAGIHFHQTWKSQAEEADARLLHLGYLPA
jgi:hypothetical protein